LAITTALLSPTEMRYVVLTALTTTCNVFALGFKFKSQFDASIIVWSSDVDNCPIALPWHLPKLICLSRIHAVFWVKYFTVCLIRPLIGAIQICTEWKPTRFAATEDRSMFSPPSAMIGSSVRLLQSWVSVCAISFTVQHWPWYIGPRLRCRGTVTHDIRVFAFSLWGEILQNVYYQYTANMPTSLYYPRNKSSSVVN